MKKLLLIALLVLVGIPSYSHAASVKVTSPAEGSQYYFGDTLPIKWTPKNKGIKTITLVPAKKSVDGGLGLYGEKVFGDPVNYSGSFDYELPKYLLTPAGEYKIELETKTGQKVYSKPFFISSYIGEIVVPVKKPKYKFGKVTGFQKTYEAGDAIDFDIVAYEHDKVLASSANSFNVQAHVFDPNNRNKGAYEAVNATYDSNEGTWNVQVTAPDNEQDYIVEVSLYCGNVSTWSYCAKTYGSNGQVQKTLKFKVRD
jgi:hypothetical protein